MSYKAIFTPDALKNYTDAVNWYGERNIIAANNFIIEIETKIENICTNPKSYKNNYKIFRETHLIKFPFSIIYFIDEENKTVSINAIFHHKRNPKYKYKK